MGILAKVSNGILKVVSLIFLILVIMTLFSKNLGLIVGIVASICVIMFFYKFDVSHKKFLIILIALSLLIRIGSVIVIHNPQVSDFQTMLEISQNFLNGELTERNQAYINEWPFQIYFIMYQTVILGIFKKVVFLKIINAVFSVLGICLIYRIVNRLSENKRVSQICTTLYAIFVNPIIYNSILSNQHVFLLLVMLAFDLIFENKFIKNDFIRMGIVGLILGIANLIRTEVLVCILAIIVFTIYMLILKHEKIKTAIAKILILLIVYFAISNVTGIILNNTKLITKNENSVFWWKFVVGLDIDNYGQWSEQRYNEFFSLHGVEQVNYAKERVIDALSDVRILKLFCIKINNFWNDFSNYCTLGYLYDSGVNMFGKNMGYTEFRNIVDLYDYSIWCVILILAFIGLFNKKSKDENKFYLIYLVGTFILYLFIEVQGRYAFVYRPFVFILSANGLLNIIEFIKNKKLINEEKLIKK